MYIKQLTIHHFGSILHFEQTLPSTLAQLDCTEPDAMFIGISLLLGNQSSLSVPPATWVGQGTRLHAEIVTNSGIFCVEMRHDENSLLTKRITQHGSDQNISEHYRTLMYRSPEEEDVCFLNASKEPLPGKLFRYWNEDTFYCPGEFRKITDGIGTTKSFRSYLKSYMEKQSLLSGNDTQSCPADQFPPSFLNFLDAVRFWDEFCKIRNLHYEGKPLLVTNLPTDCLTLLRPHWNMERQLVLLSDSNRIHSEHAQKNGGRKCKK